MQNIKLQTSDDEIIEVDVDVARYSVTIKAMMEDLEAGEDMLVLPKVKSVILTKVFEWVTHHYVYQTGLLEAVDEEDEDPTKTYISQWDKQYLQVDQSTLFEIILAAHYLKIKPLIDITCKTVAGMIQGKTAEEIRATFNIVNDFTEEEEEEMRNQIFLF